MLVFVFIFDNFVQSLVLILSKHEGLYPLWEYTFQNVPQGTYKLFSLRRDEFWISYSLVHFISRIVKLWWLTVVGWLYWFNLLTILFYDIRSSEENQKNPISEWKTILIIVPSWHYRTWKVFLRNPCLFWLFFFGCVILMDLQYFSNRVPV